MFFEQGSRCSRFSGASTKNVEMHERLTTSHGNLDGSVRSGRSRQGGSDLPGRDPCDDPADRPCRPRHCRWKWSARASCRSTQRRDGEEADPGIRAAKDVGGDKSSRRCYVPVDTGGEATLSSDPFSAAASALGYPVPMQVRTIGGAGAYGRLAAPRRDRDTG